MSSLSPSAYSNFGPPPIRMMEIVTGPPAVRLLQQSGLLADERRGLAVLDLASGAGVMTSVIKAQRDDVNVVMSDVDAGVLELAKKRAEEGGWENVEIKEANALDLPFDAASFDYVFVNLGVQFFPDQAKALSEIHRVLRPASTLSYTAWLTVPFLTLLQRADPSFSPPLAFSSPLSTRASLASFLAAAGFASEVHVEEVEVRYKWESAERFVEDMRKGMKGLFSDEERNKRMVGILKEENGEGEVEMVWEGLAVTARKA
ncbi:hypothetical protein JCM6882_003355 [Rhodosporidiobolus microsporus]